MYIYVYYIYTHTYMIIYIYMHIVCLVSLCFFWLRVPHSKFLSDRYSYLRIISMIYHIHIRKRRWFFLGAKWWRKGSVPGWWWLEPWTFEWLSILIGNLIIPTVTHSIIFFRGVGIPTRYDMDILGIFRHLDKYTTFFSRFFTPIL